MSGLYQRALYILNQDQESSPLMSDNITFDNDSGISLEDQKKILVDIEDIVSKNRITVNKKILTIKPEKRGILFPILINSIGALVIVGIFFLFQWISSQQIQQIQLNTRLYSGGDSKLISNIKKEAEVRLNEKEQEISLIQNQLQNLDEEKVKLQENMDAEIEKRNRELEEEMQRLLDDERQRLQDQGISTADIDAEIEKIKQQKELENKQELNAFKEKAEAERIEQEKQIKNLELEFKQNLDGLNNEKASLQKDLEEKENELKEFEEQQKALEQEKTEAEKALKKMAEQREKEDQLNVQIRGMYENINTQMKNGNYETARKNLEEMRGFFYDKTTATLPGILERRDVELFIIESLENLVKSELSKAEIDTASLLEKANLITSISVKANEAEKLYNRKDFAGAQKLYEEALAIIPEIEKSYNNLSIIDSNQKNQLFSDYYSKAESSYNNLQYSEAVNYYRKAIKLFPDNTARVDIMITRIMEAGYRLQGDEEAIAEDEKTANQLLSKASQALRNENYDQAIDYYVEILTKYSRTPQATSARNGINTTVTREREALTKDLDKTIAEKDQLIAEKDALISEMDKTDIILNITTKAKEADTLYKDKDYIGAKTLYEETLGIIPEVEKSHNTILLMEDTTQNELFNGYYSEAETSYNDNNYNQAIDYYTKAIKLFPQDQSLVDTMVLRIMESGYKLQGDPAVIAEEENQANQLIIKASRELREKDYEAALDAYIDVLTLYPRTSKATSAQNGIRTTITKETDALVKDNDAKIETLIKENDTKITEKDALIKEHVASLSAKDSTINGLESSITKKETEITRLEKIEQEFKNKVKQLEEDKAELEAELAALREQVESGTATATFLVTAAPTPHPTPDPTPVTTGVSGSLMILTGDEVIITKEELEEYNRLKEQIVELKDQYISYTQEEDKIITEQGTVGYLRTKTLLGDILNSEFAKEIFPDLYERIKKFDDALAEDAREDGQYIAVDNMLNIIYNRLTLDSGANASAYWDELRAEYKDDSLFLELLDELEDLMEK